MIEIQGSFWEFAGGSHAIVVATSAQVRLDGSVVMSRGLGQEFETRFTNLPLILGEYITKFGNRSFLIKRPQRPHIVTFPTKNHPRERHSIEKMLESAQEVAAIADRHQFERILVDQPGWEQSHLPWTTVKPLLDPIWDNRFFIVCHEPEPPATKELPANLAKKEESICIQK